MIAEFFEALMLNILGPALFCPLAVTVATLRRTPYARFF
jgi:hypothetical protein